MSLESGHSEIQDTQPGYPPLPYANDVRWQSVQLQARSRSEGQLCSLPRLRANHPLLTVYTGDTIAIIHEARYGVWIAAKVDHYIGWLNTIHLSFAFIPQQKTAPLPTPQTQFTSDDPDEEGDQPAPKAHIDKLYDLDMATKTDKDTIITSSDVNRIIRYLKGLAAPFKRARDNV